MKSLAFFTLVLFTVYGCKKGGDGSGSANVNTDPFNPAPGTPAAALQAKLVGTWESQSSTTTFYDKSNNVLFQQTFTGVYYWIFYAAAKDIPSDVNTYVTTLTNTPDASAYTVFIKNGINYIDFYREAPSDGKNSEVDFSDTNHITVIDTGITPTTYYKGTTMYTADHANAVASWTRIQ